MRLSDQIMRGGDISGRPGQLERLYEIAEKVKFLEALAKRYEDAPVGHYDTYHVYRPWYPGKGKEGEFVDWMVSMKQMNGQRVRIVLDKEG